jgi:DNA polymerase-3 subunit epsilon
MDPAPGRATFVAIDFETADYGADSACAVGLVRVEEGRIAARACRLIRPPRRDFAFTDIHGIRWSDVEGEPRFEEVWPDLAPLLEGADFLAAHNAPFDRGVLAACCERADLRPPPLRFECTVRLARAVWGIFPTKLPDVCRHLRIPLRHHDAASDAEACARIVIAAREAAPLPPRRPGAGLLQARNMLTGAPGGGTVKTKRRVFD